MAYPLCTELGSHDWGGIAVEWWKDAVKKYEWDVEPDSLQIFLQPWYDNRYNVMLRRRSTGVDDKPKEDEL